MKRKNKVSEESEVGQLNNIICSGPDNTHAPGHGVYSFSYWYCHFIIMYVCVFNTFIYEKTYYNNGDQELHVAY